MNILPIVEDLRIITKELGVVRLGDVMNYAQREVVLQVEKDLSEGKPCRLIILKARQIGISTIIEAIVFVLAMFLHNLKCMIIAHELDASEHLLSMTTNYWNSFQFRTLYTPKNESQKRLGWKETNSGIRITTAKNVSTGRSQTIHVLHASEVAFWPEPDTLMTGLRQSIPSKGVSIIFLESTANGLGDYFADTWDDAVAGENEYTPMFFPWHKHPEYIGSFLGLTSEMYPPPTDPESQAEEKALRAMGISEDRLVWRRYAIKSLTANDVEKFHQEYPATAEEAFLAAGTNVFPIGKLREVFTPLHGHKGRLTKEGNGRIRFQPDIHGPFKIFKYPSDDIDYGIYLLGGDPTRTTKGDPACVQVLNRRTWEQVAVWRGKIDPSSFATVLADIGIYYNNAMVCPEISGPGYATIGALLQMDYPFIWKNQWADKAPGKVAENFGWETTQKRKQWAIGNLLKAVIDHDIIIHDIETFNEMRNYVTMANGEYGPNSNDGHDDTVMALAIALTAIITEAHTVPTYGRDSGPTVLQQIEAKIEPVWGTWSDETDGDMTGIA